MKKKMSFTAMLLIVALLLPAAVRVGALEFASSSSSSSAFITFYNARDLETALYVKKQVEDANGVLAEPLADEEFEFILKLNGSVAREQQYVLYNAENKRLYNYESGLTPTEDSTKMEMELKTDRYGRFVLQDGFTAHFTGLAPGTSYEITENQYEPYEQIDPVGGTAKAGTVTQDGAFVEFRNLMPTEPPGGDTGSLQVRKRVSWPAGYELPGTPDFRFNILISGKPYANQAFTVMDLNTGLEISEGTTDGSGSFTLKGDTTALFKSVPADVDYEVKETVTDETKEAGWRVIGEALREGATVSGAQALTFGNALASFVVTKEMYGGVSTDDSFDFQVTDGAGNAYPGSITYYLYDSASKLLSTEPQQTAEDGTFTLKSGQKAVFVGLPADTEYGVRERSSGRYVQYLPRSNEGYTGKKVLDSVETLPFVNADVPSPTLLTVRKEVVNNSDKNKVPDEEFAFRISRLVSAGDAESDEQWSPLAKVAFDIIDASGTSTYETDEEGIFTLRAWKTARFTELKKGETYKVEELDDELPYDFEIGGEPEKTGTLGDDVLEMTFLNNYENPKEPSVSIMKVDEDGNGLKGASLCLVKKVEEGEEEPAPAHKWISGETAEDIPNVAPGTYYIREIKPPKGYLPAEDVEITVTRTRKVQTFTMVDKRDNSEPLPWVGGRGTRWFYVTGIMLVAAAGALLIWRRRRAGSAA